ncbi:MAG: PAS domain S-box protein [Oscillatoriales cyanobacterium RU_3_3]|nr:PAS domain S-box protein [Oscillatoriales cyanobacterium RU_3_3]
MLEKLFECVQLLRQQTNELPPQQQAILTNSLENLSNCLQELSASRQFESATNNAAKLVELEKTNRLLERTVAQQAAQIKQLQEQLQKELSQYRRDNLALTKAETNLKSLLKNSADIITILESDGRVRYHSAGMERILGYKVEARIGKVHGELIHPEDLLAWQAYFGRLLEHPGIAGPIEYRKRHADGSWVYLEAVANSLLHDSNVRGIILNSRVIGDRKQAEMTARESESHYKILSQITSDFAYSFQVAPDGYFACEWVTEAFGQVIGCVPEELASSGWWNLDLVHPEDREALIKQLEGCTYSRRGTNEYRIVNKKGEEHWVRDCWQAVWDKNEGRVVRLWGACQEITDRKQAELEARTAGQLWLAAIESSPLPVNLTDSNGKILIWNRAAEQFFGWRKEEVIGKSFPAMGEGKQQAFQASLKPLFKSQGHKGLELSLFNKEGNTLDVWMWASPIWMANGGTAGTISIFSDVSERKRIEDERQKLAALKNMEEPFWARYVSPPKNRKRDGDK